MWDYTRKISESRIDSILEELPQVCQAIALLTKILLYMGVENHTYGRSSENQWPVRASWVDTVVTRMRREVSSVTTSRSQDGQARQIS